MSVKDDDRIDLSINQPKAGYKNPPMRRRFKESGNLEGRPLGSKNRKTVVNEIANETHSVWENNKPVRRSTLELILLQLRNQAIEGKNQQASDELHRLLKTFQPETVDDNVGYLVVPAPISELAWIRRAQDSARFAISPMDRTARTRQIVANNPGISDAEAREQLAEELKAEELRILKAEKLKRAEELRKANPTLDIDEAIRLAEEERRAWLNGEGEDPGDKLLS